MDKTNKVNFKDKMFLSMLGTGDYQKSGTMGSLMTMLPLVVIREVVWSEFKGAVILLGLATIIYFYSIKLIKRNIKKNFDKKWIVTDEVVGMLIMGVSLWIGRFNYWQVLTGFLFFRLFDGLKPGIIGKVDRTDSAEAVMMDDVLAGIAAMTFNGLLIMIMP